MGRFSKTSPFTPGALLELQASRGIPVLYGDFQLTEHQFKSFNAEAAGDSADLSKRQRLSRIIGTIGPASRSVETIQQLIEAGMNIVRIEFLTDDEAHHEETIKNIKAAAIKEEANIAIAFETKGPALRTGAVVKSEEVITNTVSLKREAKVLLTTDSAFKEACTEETVYVDQDIMEVANEDSTILIDDGQITLRVISKTAGKDLECEVIHGGMLGSRKNVTVSGVELKGRVSEKDVKDIKFAVAQELDAVIVSYTQSAENIKEVRAVLGDKGNYMKVIAKICDLKGIQNFLEIAQESDGILVARGLLGNSIPPEKVFLAQKLMTTTANRMGKPIICGSQMLDSMVHKSLASRPESNDVANAVLDGADCLLLSSECALGDNPVAAVQHMASICLEAERVLFRMPVQKDIQRFSGLVPDSLNTIAEAAINATYQCMASAIVAISNTGKTACVLSAFKPKCPIICVSRNAHIARQSLFYRAIIPIMITAAPSDKWDEDMNMRIKAGMDLGASQGFIKPNDPVIVVMGLSSGPGNTNCMHIIPYVPEN